MFLFSSVVGSTSSFVVTPWCSKYASMASPYSEKTVSSTTTTRLSGRAFAISSVAASSMKPKRSASDAGSSTPGTSRTLYSNVIGASTVHWLVPAIGCCWLRRASEISASKRLPLGGAMRHASSSAVLTSRLGRSKSVRAFFSSLVAGAGFGGRTAGRRTEMTPATECDAMRCGAAYVSVARRGTSARTSERRAEARIGGDQRCCSRGTRKAASRGHSSSFDFAWYAP